MAAADGGACCWDQLPNDLKQTVLQLLPLKEVARLAQTCSEFAQRMRVMRAEVRHLALIPGRCLEGTGHLLSSRAVYVHGSQDVPLSRHLCTGHACIQASACGLHTYDNNM